jgi:hypothetical protein
LAEAIERLVEAHDLAGVDAVDKTRWLAYIYLFA